MRIQSLVTTKQPSPTSFADRQTARATWQPCANSARVATLPGLISQDRIQFSGRRDDDDSTDPTAVWIAPGHEDLYKKIAEDHRQDPARLSTAVPVQVGEQALLMPIRDKMFHEGRTIHLDTMITPQSIQAKCEELQFLRQLYIEKLKQRRIDPAELRQVVGTRDTDRALIERLEKKEITPAELGEIVDAREKRVSEFLHKHGITDEDRTVHLHLMTPGGAVSSSQRLLDTMRMMKSIGMIVATYNQEFAHSGGSVTLSEGSKGHRFVLPSSKTMIHHPNGQLGRITPKVLKETKEEFDKIVKWLYDHYERTSYGKKSREEIIKDLGGSEDHYMTADETIAYGLADVIPDYW